MLFADDQTTHHYASLFRQLRKQATPIPTNDIWVAALVLQHNFAFHDRDKHLITCRNLSVSDSMRP